MIYCEGSPRTDRTLEELEREAWQRSDYTLAQAYGALLDAQASERAAETLELIADEITTANWRTGTKAELRSLIERILRLTEESQCT